MSSKWKMTLEFIKAMQKKRKKKGKTSSKEKC